MSLDPVQPFAALRQYAAAGRGIIGSRRALADAELRFVSALVRRAPDGQLDRVMRTRLRRVVIGAVFTQVPLQVDDDVPDGVRALIRLRVISPDDGSEDVYHLQILDQRARVIRGTIFSPPHITVTVHATEFLRLLTRNADPMDAYRTGKLTLTGDIMLAIQLIDMLELALVHKRNVVAAP